MDKIDMDHGKAQSEIFEDTFLKNLKGLQAKIKQQHVQDVEAKMDDSQYIGDTTRKLIELKLLELESLINARKKEEDWLRKREIRCAQGERLAQARANLSTLLMLEEKGRNGLEDDIEDNLSILREVENMGGEEIYVKDEIQTTDKILDSFHVTEKDLRKAFNNTNIIEIMRQAKKNGWTMKISEDEIALFDKDGNRILESLGRLSPEVISDKKITKLIEGMPMSRKNPKKSTNVSYDTKFIDDKEMKKLSNKLDKLTPKKKRSLLLQKVSVEAETVKPIKRK